MQLLTIENWKKRIERQFENNLYKEINYKNGDKTFEITNFEYALTPTIEEIQNLVEPPNEEENIERKFIIDESQNMLKYFESDKNTRKASFVNDYDDEDNHCLSYIHHYIRDNKYCMNVYVRSQNFLDNFIFDNQTYLFTYFKMFEKIKNMYNEVENGYIKVSIFSLHKIIKK